MADKEELGNPNDAEHTDAFRDPDRKLPHISESFRKAKRNVLFWAAATLLLAIGSDTNDDGLEVTGFIRSFDFDQSALILLALGVLAFMFAGFIRAFDDMKALNREFAYAQSLKRGAKFADALAKNLNLCSMDISAAHGRALKMNEEAVPMMLGLEKTYNANGSAMVDLINATGEHVRQTGLELQAFLSSIKKVADVSDDDDLTGLRVLVNQHLVYLRDGQFEFQERQQTLEAQRKKIPSMELQSDIVAMREIAEAVDKEPFKVATELIEQLGTVQDGLTRYAEALTGKQERWLKWYDRNAVWATVTIATLTSIWRLTELGTFGATAAANAKDPAAWFLLLFN